MCKEYYGDWGGKLLLIFFIFIHRNSITLFLRITPYWVYFVSIAIFGCAYFRKTAMYYLFLVVYFFLSEIWVKLIPFCLDINHSSLRSESLWLLRRVFSFCTCCNNSQNFGTSSFLKTVRILELNRDRHQSIFRQFHFPKGWKKRAIFEVL